MATCPIVQGYTLACRDNVGGIRAVWLTEHANITCTATSGSVTALTLSAGKKFWLFKLESENAAFTEDEVVDKDAGTTFYQQQLAFTMKKMSAANQNVARVLALNRLAGIVLDENGTYWILGRQRGLDKTGGDNKRQSGKASGEMNGTMLSFLGKEPLFAEEVPSATITTLISGGYFDAL